MQALQSREKQSSVSWNLNPISQDKTSAFFQFRGKIHVKHLEKHGYKYVFHGIQFIQVHGKFNMYDVRDIVKC